MKIKQNNKIYLFWIIITQCGQTCPWKPTHTKRCSQCSFSNINMPVIVRRTEIVASSLAKYASFLSQNNHEPKSPQDTKSSAIFPLSIFKYIASCGQPKSSHPQHQNKQIFRSFLNPTLNPTLTLSPSIIVPTLGLAQDYPEP